MNIVTGEIKQFDTAEEREAFFNRLRDERENWIPVSGQDMTTRQKSEMRVSIKDNHSKLGKIRVSKAEAKRLRARIALSERGRK